MLILPNKAIITTVSAHLILSINGSQKISDAELELVINEVQSHGDSLRRRRACLVISDGSGPTAEQRKRMERALPDILHDLPTVIITDSTVMRFIASSLSVFHHVFPRTLAPTPDAFAEAIAHLKLDHDPNMLDALKRRCQLIYERVPTGQFKTFDAIYNNMRMKNYHKAA